MLVKTILSIKKILLVGKILPVKGCCRLGFADQDFRLHQLHRSRIILPGRTPSFRLGILCRPVFGCLSFLQTSQSYRQAGVSRSGHPQHRSLLRQSAAAVSMNDHGESGFDVEDEKPRSGSSVSSGSQREAALFSAVADQHTAAAPDLCRRAPESLDGDVEGRSRFGWRRRR